jgi:hypothetical protein
MPKIQDENTLTAMKHSGAPENRRKRALMTHEESLVP